MGTEYPEPLANGGDSSSPPAAAALRAKGPHTLGHETNLARAPAWDARRRPVQLDLMTPSVLYGRRFHQVAYGKTVAAQSVDIITSVLGTIVDIILVLILSVYLTANGQRIAQRLQNETPSAQRRHTELLIAIVNQVVGGYIRGTLTLAALVGFLVGAGMLVLHVQYAVLLGILAFFMEFIPVLGVLVSGAVCVLVALFQGWILALIVLGYFVFVHVIEGDVVGPRIMGRAVGIHPATALVALVAGTELFGIWGALFASPVAGLLQAIGTAAWREMHGADPQVVLHAVKEAAVAEVEDEDEDELGDQTDSGSRPLPRDKAPPAAGQ